MGVEVNFTILHIVGVGRILHPCDFVWQCKGQPIGEVDNCASGRYSRVDIVVQW